MPSKKKLTVGVIGPAGMTGSYTVVELLNRGHSVVGISRNPLAVGKHDRYRGISLDFDKASISEIAKAFEGLDSLVNAYGPHTGGTSALQYQPFVETTRKIVLGVKRAKVPYFIMVGGCGSLFLPGQEDETACDSRQWWLQYRRGIADSEAHVRYMEERLGHLGSSLRAYRTARLAKREGKATEEYEKTIAEYEHNVLHGDYSSTFVKSCRTTYMFFDGNQSFRWSFLSPSALFRPGKRTGEYAEHDDHIPLSRSGDLMKDKLLGISIADFAIAIVDEAETEKHVFQHWTVTASLEDDTPTPSYVTID